MQTSSIWPRGWIIFIELNALPTYGQNGAGRVKFEWPVTSPAERLPLLPKQWIMNVVNHHESPLPTGFRQMKQVILVILEQRLLFGTWWYLSKGEKIKEAPTKNCLHLWIHFVASKKHASGADLFFQCYHTVTFSDSMSRILSHFGSPPYISLHLMMDPEQNLHTAEYIWIYLNTVIHCNNLQYYIQLSYIHVQPWPPTAQFVRHHHLPWMTALHPQQLAFKAVPCEAELQM